MAKPHTHTKTLKSIKLTQESCVELAWGRVFRGLWGNGITVLVVTVAEGRRNTVPELAFTRWVNV